MPDTQESRSTILDAGRNTGPARPPVPAPATTAASNEIHDAGLAALATAAALLPADGSALAPDGDATVAPVADSPAHAELTALIQLASAIGVLADAGGPTPALPDAAAPATDSGHGAGHVAIATSSYTPPASSPASFALSYSYGAHSLGGYGIDAGASALQPTAHLVHQDNLAGPSSHDVAAAPTPQSAAAAQPGATAVTPHDGGSSQAILAPLLGLSGGLFFGTTHQDNFQGSSDKDLFDFVSTPNSLQSMDAIDGGGGNDVLVALFTHAFSLTAGLSIHDVRDIVLVFDGSPNSLDASDITGAGSTISMIGSGSITVSNLHVNLDGAAVLGAVSISNDAPGIKMVGGIGNDTFTALLGSAATTIVGGAGTDVATLHGTGDMYATVSGVEQVTGTGPTWWQTANYHVTVTGALQAGSTFTLGGMDDSLVFNTTGGAIATIDGAEHVTGSAYADNLTVAFANGRVFVDGGAGNDTITTNSPMATIAGGAGDNYLVGAPLNPNVVGGGVLDILSYEAAPHAVSVDLVTGLVVNGFGGTDTVSGFQGVIGSAYNDTITTADNTTSVDGGAGYDTVHLGAAVNSFITLNHVERVDIAAGATPSQTVLTVTDLSTLTDFDLTGGGSQTRLEFDTAGPTSLHFGTGGFQIEGVGGIMLRGGSYSLTFDSSVHNGTNLQVNALVTHGTLQFDGSQATDAYTVVLGVEGGNTLTGTSADTLVYGGGRTAHITLDAFDNSALSGTVQLGEAPYDMLTRPADHFTDFGHLIGDSQSRSAELVIGSAVTNISTVDLGTGQITGAGGTATLYAIENVTNLSATGMQLLGDGFGNHLTAGNSGDTLTGRGGADTLIGGTGADHYAYLSATDSTLAPGGSNGVDTIWNFHDTGANAGVIDVAGVSGGSQTFTGDKSALGSTFATAFAGDHAGDVDYAVFGQTTFLHVASGAGYSASDLVVALDGAHALTGTNVHLHP